MIAEAKMAKQASQQKLKKAIAESQPKEKEFWQKQRSIANKLKQTAQTRLEEAADAVIRKVVG